jgi:cytoskeleton protein RodZ
MIDTNTTMDVVSATGQDTSDSDTAGRMLRTAREAAGLHVAALAVAMKVPVKKLEALESDRLDLLPDAVFVRALASSVCRNLKIDPAPILARLPRHDVPKLGDAQRSINTPFHRAGEERVWVLPASLKQPALVLTLLLVLAAVALWSVPEWHTESAQQVGQSADDVTPTQAVAATEPFVVPPADVIADTAPVNAAAVSAVGVVPPVAAPTATVASVVTPDSVPKFTKDSVLTLTARGPTWVEVTDAKGQVLVRRNLAAGEVVGPAGQLPLSVVVGRADVTDVVIRGQAFDLAGMARDNVARFEVK